MPAFPSHRTAARVRIRFYVRGRAVTIALTGNQQDLAEAVAGFTARHAPISATRAAFDELAAGQQQPSWHALVRQGFHALHLPESAGGDGAGLVELAVVLEQAAFGLFPGPLLPTVLAGQVIAEHAPAGLAARLLPRLVTGATAASAVTAAGLRAVRSGGGWRVSGKSAPVLGGVGAQILILGAQADGRTVWFAAEADAGARARDDGARKNGADENGARASIEVLPAEPVDLTRDVARLTLHDLAVPDEQVLDVGQDRVRDLAAALFAAEAAGVARWCQRAGLEYAMVREQFGQAIGSFQAIKHKCARLFARSQLITAAAWDAAVAHGQDPGQFALAAAAAASALPAATDLGLETVTLFGGIGYTWEHDVHLYWRRATSLQALLGPAAAWPRRVAELSRATERRHDLRLDGEPDGLRGWVTETLTEAAVMAPDKQRRFLAERGLAAPHYPRPYGIEASPAAQVVILQEFERAGLAQPSTTVGEWALPTILAHGTEEQREAFVGPTLRGDLVWCQLFSEPGAGSDLASLRTRAEKADGGWRLDGQKVWTSQAAEADWAICLARTDPAAPKHKGISYFLVDMHSPGVEVRPLREANGGYLFNEVFLTGVFVPDDRLVGNPGDGWRLARTTLGNERVNIATGMGRRPVRPVDYLPALGDQASPEALAQMMTECGAITADLLAFTAMSQRLLLRQIAGLQQGPEASVLKVAAAWNATRLQQAVLSWQGPGAAIIDGTNGAASQRYLSLPPTLIGGGTLEIQLNVIAERVLGLPRSPSR
jgi:alkylation response protein AidB-like acyl-CoA dehydrogenase